jgi:Flp pilus assembly pilin Flp
VRAGVYLRSPAQGWERRERAFPANRKVGAMMSATKALLRRIVNDEAALETVEYAIITGLVVGGCVMVIAAIGVWVKSQYQGFESQVGA